MCDNPAPENGGVYCLGSDLDTANCTGAMCRSTYIYTTFITFSVVFLCVWRVASRLLYNHSVCEDGKDAQHLLCVCKGISLGQARGDVAFFIFWPVWREIWEHWVLGLVLEFHGFASVKLASLDRGYQISLLVLGMFSHLARIGNGFSCLAVLKSQALLSVMDWCAFVRKRPKRVNLWHHSLYLGEVELFFSVLGLAAERPVRLRVR